MMPNKNYKISSSLFVIAIAILLFLGWFSYSVVDSAKQKIISDIELELARIERNLFDNIEHTDSIISSINSNIRQDPYNKKHIFNILKTYRDDYKFNKTLSWTIFSWVDNKGQLVVDAKYGILKEPINALDNENTEKCRKEPDRLHISAPIIGLTSKKLVIPLGMGTYDNYGNYLGATTVGFEINSLGRILHSVIKNPDINFKLLDEKGEIMIDGNFKNFSTDVRVEDSKFFNKLKNHNLNKFEEVSIIANPRAILIKRSENYPYIFIVEYNKNSIRKELLEVVLSRISEALAIIFSLIILVYLTYREITQIQKSMRLKILAKRANQSKSEFLIKAAHEFKNFIFGIQGCAEVVRDDLQKLQKHLQKSEDGKKLIHENNLNTDIDLVREIIEAAHDLDHFINEQIEIDYNKEHDLQINLSFEPINIERIIKSSIKLLEKRAQNSQINLEAKIEKDLYKISKLDEKIIKQIIVNLISSSIKYGNSNNNITVKASNIDDLKTLENIYKIHGIRKERAVEIVVSNDSFKLNHKEMKTALQQKGAHISRAQSLASSLYRMKYLIEKQGGIFEIKSNADSGNQFKIIL